ncbi:MAG: hypothetical protein Q9220_006159 [cf. Caloplaca sp. 1 TL-2023]
MASVNPYEQRLAPTVQSHPELPSTKIKIKHPGYHENDVPLLQLIGFDHFGNNDGIHYGTALTACAIISGRTDGFLTKERSGVQDLALQLDDILQHGSYYFMVHDDPKYAVYPTFRQWQFPHQNLPQGWGALPQDCAAETPTPTHSDLTNAVVKRDHQCILSGDRDILEGAHICPSGETDWFKSNAMRQYNRSQNQTLRSITDDMSNLVALRRDLHFAFDTKKMFVLVPKKGDWRVNFLQPSHDLHPRYHNKIVKLSHEIAPEHLLTRFAWIIFPQLHGFLTQGPSRRVRVTTEDAQGNVGEMEEELGKASVEERFFPRPARSESPKKRGRQDDDYTAEVENMEDIQESKGYKVFESQPTALSDLPSLTATEACDESSNSKSISITAASLNPATALPEEQIINYCFDDNGVDDPDPRIRKWYRDEEPLDRLRRLEVERRRPTHNPGLFCCDYAEKERTCHAAIKGEGEWDAYQLCDECMGGEYELRAQDIVDEDWPISPTLLEAPEAC